MTLLLSREDVQVHHASWSELAAALPRREDGTVCDALIVDAPYSEKTHAGHDGGVMQSARLHDAAKRTFKKEKDRRYAAKLAAGGRTHRRQIDYPPWSETDIDAFVSSWAPLTRGWFITITDDVLAPAWAAALESQGRYVFAPLPFVSPGSRVRLTGDGPSAWTCWLVVARPSCLPFSRWGTLQGAYVYPPEDMPVVGGKPLSLMRALVRDYSRPGDVVCDPCAGAGTTGLAAKLEGRSFIGGDSCLEHAEIAAERLRDVPTAEKAGTLALFREVG